MELVEKLTLVFFFLGGERKSYFPLRYFAYFSTSSQHQLLQTCYSQFQREDPNMTPQLCFFGFPFKKKHKGKKSPIYSTHIFGFRFSSSILMLVLSCGSLCDILLWLLLRKKKEDNEIKKNICFTFYWFSCYRFFPLCQDQRYAFKHKTYFNSQLTLIRILRSSILSFLFLALTSLYSLAFCLHGGLDDISIKTITCRL